MGLNISELPVKSILNLAHSPVKNYIIAGLTSSLIGEKSTHGCVRLFENERDHQDQVTPHSHRFDFTCVVLKGTVTNRIWRKSYTSDKSDLFRASTLRYCNEIGKHMVHRTEEADNYWSYRDYYYEEGECYAMRSEEVHSIIFGRDTKVLFFEGPTLTDESIIIEPIVDGELIPTYKIEDYMFRI